MVVAMPELEEGGERGLDHIGMILRAKAFGEHILDASRFENGAHASAGDDPGPGAGRAQQDLAAAKFPIGFVRNRVFADRHFLQFLLRRFGRLLDRV